MTAVAQSDTENRSDLLALLGWMTFVVLLVYTVFIGGGYDATLLGEFRLVSLAVIGVALVTWAILALLRPAWRPRSAIWPALVLPIAALVLTSLASDSPRLGAEYVLWATVLVALYVLLARIMSFDFARQRIGGVAAILAFIVAGAYLIQSASLWVEYWELLGRLTAPMLRPAYAGLPFGRPPAVASVTILLTVVAFIGLGLETRGRQVVLAGLVAIAAAAVFVTGGRTAWLAGAVGIVAIGLVFVARNRWAITSALAWSWAALRRRRWQVVAIGLALLAGIGVIVFAPALIARVTVGGDGGRTIYLTTALRMFEDSPLIGQGPGTWAAQRMVYTQAGEPDYFVSHTHNTYSQTLAELGLLGIVVGLISLLVLLWLVRDGLRDASVERRRYAYGALFVLLYMSVYALLDSYVNFPLAFVLVALPFALLDGTARRAVSERLVGSSGFAATLRTIGGVGLFVMALIAVLLLVRVESVATDNRRAVSAVYSGEWESALEMSAAVVDADPDMIPYHITRGMAAAGAGDWSTAVTAFEQVATADDRPEAWVNLAFAKLEAGHPTEEVTAAIERALRVGHPSHASVQLAAAFIYDRLGMTAEADDLYTNLLARRPGLAADPYWPELLGDQERFERLVHGAMERTPSPWVLDLMAGEPEEAIGLAADAAEPALALDIIAAWTGDADAAERVRERSRQALDDGTLAEWATRVTARQGDGDLAADLRRLRSIGQQGGAGLAVFWGWEDGLLPVVGEPRPGTAQEVARHADQGYRRSAPVRLLVPGLPAIVLVDGSAEAGEDPPAE